MKSFEGYINWIEGLIEEDPLLLKYTHGCCTFETKDRVEEIPQMRMVFVLDGGSYSGREVLTSLGYKKDDSTERARLDYHLASDSDLFIHPDTGMAGLVKSEGKLVLIDWHLKKEHKGLVDLLKDYDKDEDILLMKGQYVSKLGTYIDRYLREPAYKRLLVDANLEVMRKVIELGIPATYGSGSSAILARNKGD